MTANQSPSPGEGDRVLVSKEMGITPPDFIRLLPRAVRGWDYEVTAQTVKAATIVVGGAARGVAISIQALADRRITALMVLPRSQVELSFQGLTSAEQQDFLTLFDRAYQRGGG
ncbi:MAG: hypothetical protein AAF530_01565 [Pseudomonadota bacterium]